MPSLPWRRLRVRAFRLDDYEQVRALWVATGLEIRPGDSKEEIRSKLERDPELFLVAEEGGKTVGTAMGTWDGRRGWIYHLGVLPGWQRKGVATALVREVEARMRAKGVLKVNAIVYEDNERSSRFFVKAGYAVERRSVIHGKFLAQKG
jgi:ribosomal protein S18 acetylase RimI-like enzyme